MKTSQTDTLKNFQDSDAPQCLYDGQNNIYKLNEAAYRQIAHIADMLAAMSCYSRGGDKREEQLFNTLHFVAETLEQSLSWNCE